jgi:hypothetical protein
VNITVVTQPTRWGSIPCHGGVLLLALPEQAVVSEQLGWRGSAQFGERVHRIEAARRFMRSSRLYVSEFEFFRFLNEGLHVEYKKEEDSTLSQPTSPWEKLANGRFNWEAGRSH